MIHIRDEETDRIVRDLALRLGVSITEAVKIACTATLNANRDQGSLWDRTADLRGQIAQFPSTGETADKKFYDDLND